VKSTTKKLLASLAILAAVGAFMSFGVFSLFSTTASNTSNVSSATFGLTQSPVVGNLLDTITSLIPGDVITRCVKLTNSGTAPIKVTATPTMANGTSSTLNTVVKMSMDEVSNVDTSTEAHLKACDPTSGNTVSSVQSIFGATAGSALGTLGSNTGVVTLPPTTGSSWSGSETHVYQIVMTLPSTVTDFATFGGKSITPAVAFTADQVAGSAK
jgi:spore coat-associated protein N